MHCNVNPEKDLTYMANPKYEVIARVHCGWVRLLKYPTAQIVK